MDTEKREQRNHGKDHRKTGETHETKSRCKHTFSRKADFDSSEPKPRDEQEGTQKRTPIYNKASKSMLQLIIGASSRRLFGMNRIIIKLTQERLRGLSRR